MAINIFKYKRKILDASLTCKLGLLFSIIICLSIVFFSLFYMNRIRKTFFNQAILHSNINFLGLFYAIDTEIENIIEMATTIAYDETIQKTLAGDTSKTDDNPHLKKNDIETLIENIISEKDFIKSVEIITHDEKYFKVERLSSNYKERRIYQKIDNIMSNTFYHRLISASGVVMWGKRKTDMKLILAREIYYYLSIDISLGFIILEFNFEQIIERFKSNLYLPKNAFYILKDDIQISLLNTGIEFTDYTKIENQMPIAGLNENIQIRFDKDFYYFIKKSNINNFSFLQITARENLEYQFGNEVRILVFWGILIILLFFIILFVILIFIITNPLKKLTDYIEQSSIKNFTPKKLFKRNDEIGKLASVFNNLLVRENEYIDKAYKAKLKQNEMEIAALQSQISPHFMSNIFDLIKSYSDLKDVPEISRVTLLLSKLFRISTCINEALITIREEIKNTELYIDIQKIIFQGNIKLKINIASEYYDYKIPKLLIQPIIENSFIHGFEKNQKDNLIQIKCKKNNNYLDFEIDDNGKGMPSKYLFKESIYGTGITNIKRRLSNLFHNDYSIKIQNNSPGTVVLLTIPVIKKQEAI